MKKLFMFLAVAGLLTFTANIAFAQGKDAAPANEEQVDGDAGAKDAEAADADASKDEAKGQESKDSEEGVALHEALKTKFIEGGPLFMSLIIICLILGMAIAVERILFLAFSKSNTAKLLNAVEAALEKGGVEEAKKVCRNTRGPVASIFYQGLLRADQGVDVVEKTIVSYGSVQMSLLENGLSWIGLFISIAPSLGFLGTVIGMIQAFDAIQTAGDISPNVVAGGMKVALITTVGGLIVAMILQIFYNYIIAKIDSLSIDMEDSSIRFVDMMVKHNK
ncbi:MAG: MotA/TolQ/ExbB proton channel family protein [Bacteroidales bacterium]|nr:MotA/TolQ/ExbB proton channel family protein [Bacteroidales bacterium]